MRIRRRSSWIALLMSAPLAFSCGAGDGERPAAMAAAAPGEAAAHSGASLPPAGEVRVSLDAAGLATVLASAAPRGAIVSALAERSEFGVMIGEEARLDERLTVQIAREPTEVALARVLAGLPHALEYAPDPASGASRLALVTIGRDLGGGMIEATAPATAKARRRVAEGSPEEAEARAERARQLWKTSLENLESNDPELRADGARWLDVSSADGFEAAVDHLQNDESSEVRIAAAETLVDSDAGAVQPLLHALVDRDPNVVLAALEALEFVGDASTVPHLQTLLMHPSDEVRERTREAIDYLE